MYAQWEVGSGLIMLPSVCDLDGDGRYGETGGAAPCGDEAGPTPTFWAADLPDPNSTITVRLRVRDFWGAVREDTATIHVTSYGEFFDPLVHISPDDINEGGHLTAWTSGPPDFASSYNDANVYLWDLDGDGIYGDSPGESGKYVSFGWSQISNATVRQPFRPRTTDASSAGMTSKCFRDIALRRCASELFAGVGFSRVAIEV